MWRSSFRDVARDLARDIADITEKGNLSRRLAAQSADGLADVVREVNALLEAAEKREQALHRQLNDLMDARDDAQQANQLMRRLKNELQSRSAERDAALMKAQAASSAKSQFLANMSHEIRTPMHGILGLAEVLARTPLDARQSALVQTVLRSGRGLLGIINDILDFSKIESGKLDLAPRAFSLKALVNDLVAGLTPRFEKKGIELLSHIDRDLPDVVVGDQSRIKQVLSNLLANGLKFTEQGYVMLELEGQFKGDTIALIFKVQDSGVGIATDKQAIIFEQFNQVDNSSTRRHEGTGLGLAICRMLVERMGGKVDVLSTVGKGSTFIVTLDLPVQDRLVVTPHQRALEAAKPSPQPASQPASQPSAAPVKTDGNIVSLGGALFQRRRVLLVEDNIVNQEVASAYLEDMGCAVTVAANGREGVDAVRAGQHDLILMDCLMPEVDGFAATRTIRRLETHRGTSRTPIIALTASAYEKDRLACLAAGMDDFLSKPFNFEDLERMVRRWSPDRSNDTSGERSNDRTNSDRTYSDRANSDLAG